jgi:hypothetical protein
MDINTALDNLSGLFDCLYESGFLTEEEKQMMCDVEDTIINYVKSKGDLK